MDDQLVELCAKALWDKSQADPVNQYKLSRIFKKTRPGPISWKEINDLDIIPSLANEYREKAKVAIRSIRKYIAIYSKDSDDMLSVFLRATSNGEC